MFRHCLRHICRAWPPGGASGHGTKTARPFGVLTFAIIAGDTAWVACAPFGGWVYGHIAAGRAGRDGTAVLPDGLHVILCRSASPQPVPTRAGPRMMVDAGRQPYLVGAGEGGGAI